MYKVNKRGAVESDTGVNWGVAIIVLVVLTLIVVFGYTQFSQISKLSPDEVSNAASYCKLSPYASDSSQYCRDYKPFSWKSTTYYYNCYEIGTKLVNPKPEWAEQVICSSPIETARSYCANRNNTDELKTNTPVYISDKACLYGKKGGIGADKDQNILTLEGKQIDDFGVLVITALEANTPNPATTPATTKEYCLVSGEGCLLINTPGMSCGDDQRYSDSDCQVKI